MEILGIKIRWKYGETRYYGSWASDWRRAGKPRFIIRKVKEDMYSVEFTYDVPEWGTVEFEPVDPLTTEEEARSLIKDLYPEATNIEVTSIKEIK